MRTRIVGLILVAAIPGLAQIPVSVGVKGGLFFTESTTGVERIEDRPYTVGPSIEMRLPKSFALEFNPLYKRTGYRAYFADILGSFTYSRVRNDVWEFPVLGKYYRGPWFAAGGYTARRRSPADASAWGVTRNADGSIATVFSGPTAGTPARFDHGFAAGTGLRTRVFARLKLSVEYRYSRFATSDRVSFRGVVFGPTQNQHEVLAGFAF
ncbi:MAG TPA: hypothetical protein DEH78_12395 [Solibacterales bacterium]|nr:hypothetical protein [Bryobacterales bacterium]